MGQDKAKRAVAVALRNRYRRRLLSEDLREEVIPKNILMIGPTGVGKTEIARRLANLAGAPFVKVEATKFTEVGYVGRDVDSMVRDLVQRAVGLVESERIEEVRPIAEQRALDRILDIMEPPARQHHAGQGCRISGSSPCRARWGIFSQAPAIAAPEPTIEEEPTGPTPEYERDQIDRKERIRERLQRPVACR